MSYSSNYTEELRQRARYEEGDRDGFAAFDPHASGHGYEGEDRDALDSYVCGFMDGWNRHAHAFAVQPESYRIGLAQATLSDLKRREGAVVEGEGGVRYYVVHVDPEQLHVEAERVATSGRGGDRVVCDGYRQVLDTFLSFSVPESVR